LPTLNLLSGNRCTPAIVVVHYHIVSYNRTYHIALILVIYGGFLVPIYEYQCKGCQHQFDLLQKINDEPIKKCPQCSKDTVVRLVSAAAFQLKGTGWYATDFKDKAKPAQTSDGSVSKTVTSDAKTAEKKTTEPSTVSSVSSKGESD
jgi:putative FmdB family regulatory protein